MSVSYTHLILMPFRNICSRYLVIKVSYFQRDVNELSRIPIYDTIDIIGNIPGTLSIKYIDPLSFQSFGEGAFGTVGTGHTEAGILQNLCETAHADTDVYKRQSRKESEACQYKLLQ